MPEYFGEAVNALVRLAKLDPGGRLANRPLSSLESIFCVWKPQSGVDRDRRLQALRSLVDRDPEVAWRLLPELVPKHFQTLIPSRQPVFGTWAAAATQPTFEEAAKDIDSIAEVLLISATTPKLLWELTKIVDRLPTQRRSEVWSRWAEFASQRSPWIEEAREHWPDLDELARRHRTHEDRDWALPPEEIDEIRALADSLRPTGTIDEHVWLFEEWHPNLGDFSPRNDFDAYREVLDERRAEAVGTVSAEHGTEGVVRLARAALDAGGGDAVAVGMALARSMNVGASSDTAHAEGTTLDDVQLIEWAALVPQQGDLDAHAKHRIAEGYYIVKRNDQNEVSLVERARDATLSPSEQAALLISWQKYPDAWDVAASLGAKTATEYWRRFRPWGLGEFEHAQIAAEHLLEVGRADAAVDLLGSYLTDDDALSVGATALAVRALGALPEVITENGVDGMLRHLIGELHEWIWRASRSLATVAAADGESDEFSASPSPSLTQLAEMEARLLASAGDCIEPRFLHRLTAEDSAVFTLLMSVAFEPDESQTPSASSASEQDVDLVDAIKPSPEDTSGQPLVAILQASPGIAFRVAHSWRTVPGSDPDGSIDYESLIAWIDQARNLLVESNRLDIGDEYIGHALAGAAAGDDAVRIPPAVRDALDD